MMKALKICAGMAAIGFVGMKAYMVGQMMPLIWSLYTGDYTRADACTKAIEALYGRNSVRFKIILEASKEAVNHQLKYEGSKRRVKYKM